MNEEQQRRQKRLKFLIVSLMGFFFVAFSSYVLIDYFVPEMKVKKHYTTTTDLPMDGIDPHEIWVDQIRTENEIVQGKVDFIQDILVKKMKDEGEREITNQNEIAALRSEINSLRGELKNSQTQRVNDTLRSELKAVSANYGLVNWEGNDHLQASIIPQETFAPLSAVSCSEQTNLHHVNRTIPAGTSVKAIILSSVDMPCGVNGPSDPLPVKLRIIADGRLPHEVRARLKSGIVTASVYGDLSSERVYFRLEKLTQIRPDGHFIETQVAGYVSGEDGKYGVRGVVVDKSSQLIENALLSGFLSGVSSFFEAAAMSRLYPTNIIEGSCGTNSCSTPSWGQSAGQLAIAGGSQGGISALDELTDYFIRRAEQLRPVIQITPGRIVDITFSDCADLGDLYTHERVRNSGKRGIACDL